MNIIVTRKFAKDVEKELNEQQKQELAQILPHITQFKILLKFLIVKSLKVLKMHTA